MSLREGFYAYAPDVPSERKGVEKFLKNKLKRKLSRRQKVMDEVRKEAGEEIRAFIKEYGMPTESDIKQVIRELVEESAPKVQCHSCKYTWAPNPYRWKDDPENPRLMEHKGTVVKPIICPACNAKNKIAFEVYLKIIDWWGTQNIVETVALEEFAKLRKPSVTA